MTGEMLDNVATPFLLIDAAAVRRNLDRLAKYAGEHNIRVRPHTKTHKSKRLARLQLDAGAVGLTAAKVGEAEVMASVADDVLIAFPAVDLHRTRRLAQLALHKTVRIGIDSRIAARSLAAAARSAGCTLGILVDLDVGMHRTGVASPGKALTLAQLVDSEAGLRLDGLMFFPGHICGTAAEQEPLLATVSQIVSETVDLWAEHGLEASIVSGGSTPTAFNSHLVADLTEIRPGTYVYYDANCFLGGYCSLEDCAARVVCTVVSDAVPGQVVIDAGSKTLTSDPSHPQPDAGFGYVVEYPEARITRLTEEHGQIDITECASQPQIGERVTVIPNHICPCVNLQDSAWWLEADGRGEPLPIDARGKLS